VNLRQLEYLVALAGEGSFGRAAARCNASQPAVSVAIAKLESELGVELVQRESRGAVLTPPGESLLRWAREALASVDAIRARNPKAFQKFEDAKKADPSLSEHLIVHKPWIDAVELPCKHEGCGGTMKRVPEVIDCWFDSGCMPFAQWGYPHASGSKERFETAFPADFISEAIDQTRGWFYSLLMISTLVFGERPLPHPYETCPRTMHALNGSGSLRSGAIPRSSCVLSSKTSVAIMSSE